jgi:type II secretory ATPase GspE/PulE/Tfp pilus assembly ATPase PilB-like protein
MAAMRTRGAPETIGRLLDLQIDRHGLAGALTAVLAQRLVRGLCPLCRVSHPATAEERAAIVEELGAEAAAAAGFAADTLTLWRAPGCRACAGSGEQGRVAVHEMLTVTDEIKEAIVDSEPAEHIRRLAMEQGMVSLVVDGIGKAVAGQVDLNQVLSACSR